LISGIVSIFKAHSMVLSPSLRTWVW
jgi:hypothetical protein